MKKRRICIVLMIAMMMVLGICSLDGCVAEKGERAAAGKADGGLYFDEPQYDWGDSTGETLTVWGAYPDLDRSYITKAFERYETLTGNRLELVQMSKDAFASQMLLAFNGDGEKPDIVLSYGGTSIEAYDPDENFYDFSDAVWLSDLTDTSINQTVYNGRIIGLPHWEASISGTLYNKKIFDTYDVELPRTQEAFMEVCARLLEQGITPVYLPGKEISMLLYQFPLDVVLEDSQLLDGLDNGSLGYSDLPGMDKIIRWYKDMAEKGYFGENYESNNWDGMNEAMSSGDYAMMLCWDTWLYTDFTGNPEDFGLMPAFMGLPDAGTFEGPNLGLFIVNRHSEKLETALDFITFLADPYNYNPAFEGVYTAPVFKNQAASISTPQYTEAERLIERNFRDSTAWMRVRGFSQNDAVCILEYMKPDSGITLEQCLLNMDVLRNHRLSSYKK